MEIKQVVWKFEERALNEKNKNEDWKFDPPWQDSGHLQGGAVVFSRLCSSPFPNSQNLSLPPSSTLQASSSQSGAICNRNGYVNACRGMKSWKTQDKHQQWAWSPSSVFILPAAQYTEEDRIKHGGSTDVRYGHGFLPDLLAIPLAALTLLPYLPTSHSCLIQNDIKISEEKNSPLRRHEDLGMVVSHRGAILPGKVVDVVALLVGQAGRRLKFWTIEQT